MKPFERLNLDERCSKEDVIRAWRRLARHTDKTGSADDGAMKELNEAKELCLGVIIERDHTVSEQQYVWHMCRVLERGMAASGVDIDFDHGTLVAPLMHRFFYIRAADAIEWVLLCGTGKMEFIQEKEDEIPILRKFYNEFIREDGWSDDDRTIMTVLNKYEDFKKGGYGNFALNPSSAPPSSSIPTITQDAHCLEGS
jgi:hypothetical protein